MDTAHESPAKADGKAKPRDRRAYNREYSRKQTQARRAAKKASEELLASSKSPPQGAKYPGTPSWNDEVKASAPTQPVPKPAPDPKPAPPPEPAPEPPKPNPDDDLIEVRLLHNYVPFDGAIKAPYPGNNPAEVVYEKIPAGTTIKIPRVEARRALQLGIAAIDHDLI